MKRKDFLKNSLGIAGVAIATPILGKTSFLKNKISPTETLACSVTNSETAGPFPTKVPSSLIRTNIVGDRTGVAFTINIYIMNTQNNCAALQGALVDIWHCDKDGYYSEYGGTSMQTVDYTNNHFLRGRQTTDANGLVSFTSIFPGWYQSRATHIHVHIYKADGTSLLVTQIAFPEGSTSANAVYNVNVNGSSYGYTKGMSGYTYNSNDNVFSDGVTNEMSTVTGSLSGGYTLTHTIYVAGGALGTTEVGGNKNFKISQNYPNPFKENTTLPITLTETSTISVVLVNVEGRKVKTILENKRFSSGNQEINISGHQLSSGIYYAIVTVENSSGKTNDSVKLIVK